MKQRSFSVIQKTFTLVRGGCIFISFLPKFFTVTSIALYSEMKITFFSLALRRCELLGEDTLEQSGADWPGLQAGAGNGSSPAPVPGA